MRWWKAKLASARISCGTVGDGRVARRVREIASLCPGTSRDWPYLREPRRPGKIAIVPHGGTSFHGENGPEILLRDT